jgi:hypothetical protein
VQEALSNIMKHAGRSAEVTLVLDAAACLHIEVEDDGEGFDPALAAEGIGIIGMRERVYALGGTIDGQLRARTRHHVTIALPTRSPQLRYRSGFGNPSRHHHVERIEHALRTGQPEPDHHLGRLHRLVRSLARQYPNVLRFGVVGTSDAGVPIHAGVVSATACSTASRSSAKASGLLQQ